jgi:hypothetical protein
MRSRNSVKKVEWTKQAYSADRFTCDCGHLQFLTKKSAGRWTGAEETTKQLVIRS